MDDEVEGVTVEEEGEEEDQTPKDMEVYRLDIYLSIFYCYYKHSTRGKT